MKRLIAERQKRNLELGAMDAANRCAWCKVAVPWVSNPIFTDADGHKFCSLFCQTDFTEAAQAKQPTRVGRR